MARLTLVPQKREFFDLYNQAASNAVAISQRLIELLDEFPAHADERMRDIKELEHAGDRLTHELVDLINRTFVTPFDRDDMYRLAGVLDDICDHVDDSAEKVVGYGVREIREQARQQAQVINRAATKLAEAIGRLEGFRDSKRQLIELRELEDEEGRVREAFAPDFYLTEQGLYIELTFMKQSLVTRKNRKLRKLRERYPDVKIKLFYKRDLERLAQHFRLDLVS